ncbi:MAG TPA: MFS transporter [Thermoflexales bacterium]|nr:MFS transporter [Thermoflexales bacterium]HQY23253.1 MFS transporter [Thermoflexales bacterium]HQZ52290.1 MFS transporter [Thermoflexales bacterium]HRA52840.1 MFS transporter [Thermoflexales bacterium]
MSELVSSAADAALRPPQRDSRRNLIAFFGDMGAFNIGMYFMPTTTILVGLASLLTDDKALIGIVGLAWKASWYLPQLLAARLLHGRPRKKPYLFWSALFGRQTILLLALWLIFTQGSAPLLTVWLIIGAVAIFSGSDALASIAWFDLLGRAFTPRMRSRLFAVGQFVGSLIGIGVGVIAERLLANEGWPVITRYAAVLICGYLGFQVSTLFVILIQELPPVPGAPGEEHVEQRSFRDLLSAAFSGDVAFRRALLGRGLTFLETMVSSFYVVFAKNELGLGPEAVGLFSVAFIVGSVIGVAIFGTIADRFGTRRVSQLASWLHFLAPMLVLLIILVPGLAPIGVSVMLVVMGINGALEHSLVMGYLGYAMDIASDQSRGAYIAAINTLSGLISLSPFLGGVLIDSLTTVVGSRAAYGITFGGVSAIVMIGAIVALGLPKPGPARAR